jgi:magnesium chelatase subunit D
MPGPAGEPAAEPVDDALQAWTDAMKAATLLAVDPWGLGGLALHAGHGPVREQVLASIQGMLPPGTPWRRVPIHVGDDRLLGGLDLTATLAAGRPVAQTGLLAEADGGLLVLAMAERVSVTTAARLCAALDTGECVTVRDGLSSRRPARVGVIALDEGTGDDPPPAGALLERLAFRVDLGRVPPSVAALTAGGGLAAVGTARADAPVRSDGSDGSDDGSVRTIAAARARLPGVEADDRVMEALCATAAALGVDSLRAPVLALRAARVVAALEGRDRVGDEDAALAARLVLAPRATRWPDPTPPEDAEPPPEPPPDPDTPDDTPDDPPTAEDPDTADAERPLDEVVLEAARAAIPAGLLAALALSADRAGTAGAGRVGVQRAARLRGRPAGVRPGLPRDGARLAVVDTLRAAAPWQRLRGRQASGRLALRAADLRIARLRERTETTTIFAIDASGSSALHRLAEAKGAVELLLADCYVRRDRVAVIAFRGRGAEVLLAPTRSLVRARRSLAGLPGGGGTPLAAGIDAAAGLVDGVLRRGGSPVVVLLTDGRANVARDGGGGRTRADEEARDAARRLRASGCATLLIDTSPQPQPAAAALALAMSATYVPLPRADAAAIARPVRAAVAEPHRRAGRGR